MAALFVGCGEKPATTTTGGTTTGGTTATPSSTPVKVALSASSASVKSDNSTTSDITATVLDASNAIVTDALVLFSSTGGQISSSSAITDANGRAAIVFSAGANRANQITTITATLGTNTTVSSQIPIKIVGSTISLTPTRTSISSVPSGGDTLTISVVDSSSIGIANEPVTLTQAGAGGLVLTPSTAVTDLNGNLTVTVTGATAGLVTVTVTAAGSTATQNYTVTGTGVSFAITSPATDPYSLATNLNLPVAVSVPPGITSVTFATSLGTWLSSGQKTAVVPVVAGAAVATLSSLQAGLATLQVYDTAQFTTSDSTTVVFSQPAINAGQISLQANVNVVDPSIGGATNTVTLTATVRSLPATGGQAVGGAPVIFSIPNATGGGEFVSPVVALTDASGIATATFTSGSVSTGTVGVFVEAALINKPAVLPASAKIVIGGTAASVVVGYGTKIIDLTATEYALPMSVLVADGNGNAVEGAKVTLKAFPASFSIGYWYDTDPNPTSEKFAPCVLGTYQNEDLNKNAILDAGEDLPRTSALSCDIYGAATGVVSYLANGQIDAPNAAAGTLPGVVTTDVNGVANFNLIYQKSSSEWIIDEIVASTQVLGTEATSTVKFRLPFLKADGETGTLPSSVFGN